MTKREFLTAVSAGEMTDELKEFAAAEIAKMDNSAAARSAKPSKARVANMEVLANLLELGVVCDEPKTATEVSEVLECTTQKASTILKLGVEEGYFVQTDVKLPKKGPVKAYTLASAKNGEE